MKKKRFTEEQIIGILREQEAGAKAAALTATGDRLRNPDQLPDRLLLTPRPWAYQPPGLNSPLDETSGARHISYGGTSGVMSAFSHALDPDDRWEIGLVGDCHRSSIAISWSKRSIF